MASGVAEAAGSSYQGACTSGPEAPHTAIKSVLTVAIF